MEGFAPKKKKIAVIVGLVPGIGLVAFGDDIYWLHRQMSLSAQFLILVSIALVGTVLEVIGAEYEHKRRKKNEPPHIG